MITGKVRDCGLVLGLGWAISMGCNDASQSASNPQGPPSLNYPARPAVGIKSDPSEAPVTITQQQSIPGLSAEDATAIVHTPIVFMSGKHESTCLLRVGDTFPLLELTSASGEVATLPQHHGERLTVVVFWSLRYPPAVEQLSRLNQEVVQRFAKTGVQVVAVNVGDAIEDVVSLQGKLDLGEVVSLLDTRGEGFAQIASGILPRTYLLDASGTIKWFDIEYSRSTRRELRNAIIYSLRGTRFEAEG